MASNLGVEAIATHRSFSFACVGAAMANETWIQSKSKNPMEQVLGIKNEAAHETLHACWMNIFY